MSARRLATGSPGAYSDAVVVDDHCYVSGQLPVDFATEAVLGETVAEQTAVVIGRVFAVLEQAGFAPEHLTSVTVLLADVTAWEEFNAVYRRLLQPHGLPARMAFAVPQLHYGALVELQAIAQRPA
jgi:2-iminobutanoate/2-iminopropanoate deaminase